MGDYTQWLSPPPTPRQQMEYAVMPYPMEQTALNGVVANNMDKDFVQRIKNQNPNVSNAIRTPNGRMTHFMANAGNRVFPTVMNTGQPALQRLPRGMRPPEAINMQNPEGAEWFATNYKRTNPEGFR